MDQPKKKGFFSLRRGRKKAVTQPPLVVSQQSLQQPIVQQQQQQQQQQIIQQQEIQPEVPQLIVQPSIAQAPIIQQLAQQPQQPQQPQADQIITLNVGGKKFPTLPATLLKFDNSKFATILSRQPQPDGSYFIDRSPELFPVILDYLRNGQLSERLCMPPIHKDLEKELDFYAISIPEMQGYRKILRGTDGQFPSFLQGFNRRWEAPNCEAIYLCFTSHGTVLALNDAILNYNRDFRIKSGGHCYENFVFSEKTRAILDVSPMTQYGYDKEKGYFLESGGTNWSAFQGLFRDYNRVLPAGSCYSVGLGGHICGGGYGLLSRLYGLTVDWLTGVEVVVKEHEDRPARLVYVSDKSTSEEEQNLYWSHRGGGGGNYGVITRYYFKDLPLAPSGAYITAVSYTWDDLTSNKDKDILGELLSFFANFAARTDNNRQWGELYLFHSQAGNVNFAFQTAVKAGENPKEIKQKFIHPVIEELRKIQPFQHFKPGINKHSQLNLPTKHTKYYTIYEAAQTLNGSGANQRGKYKSAYMRKPFDKHQVTTLLKYLTKEMPANSMKQTLLQVDTYGGEINTKPSAFTPIPQRSSILKLQYQTYWADARHDDLHLEWMRDFYHEMYIESGGVPDPSRDQSGNVDGCYYNYPDVDLNYLEGFPHLGLADPERALRLYFQDNLKRLQNTKWQWDRHEYFHHNQSINPIKPM